MGAMPRAVTWSVAVPTVTGRLLMGGVLRVVTWPTGGAVRTVTGVGSCVLTVLSLLIPALLFLPSGLVRLVRLVRLV